MTAAPMIPISVIIITFNEADRIAETISSVRFCDEILVVDSGSTDGTADVARRMGAKVIERGWGGYSEQKNFAAEIAAFDWVFSLDADERPSAELAAEIAAWKRSDPSNSVAACSMPRMARYMGRWIRHSGWYPDRKVRIYDRRRSRWEGIVHERLDVDGNVQPLEGDLLHFPFRSLDDHYRTIERYTRLAAEEQRGRGRRFNPARLVLSPPLYFLKSFLLRGGVLDGWAGLRIAWMGARYVFLREFRILR